MVGGDIVQGFAKAEGNFPGLRTPRILICCRAGNDSRPRKSSIRPAVDHPRVRGRGSYGGVGPAGGRKNNSDEAPLPANVNRGRRFSVAELPLLIRLRDLNNARTASGDLEDLVIERIQSILDIPLTFPSDLESDENLATRRSLRERVVVSVLEAIRPLILLDGLDEVSHKLRRDSIVAGVLGLRFSSKVHGSY